jgi:hypothetical protein
MRTDPTDNGGLFIGRRPGTRPVHYRGLPQRGSAARGAVDEVLATALLLGEIVICLMFWGPLPLLWLWVGGHVKGATDNVGAAIVAAFAGLMACLLIGLVGMRWLDNAWVLVRRAAGHDQRTGKIGIVFAVTSVLGATAFSIWFFIIHGPGSVLQSGGG